MSEVKRIEKADDEILANGYTVKDIKEICNAYKDKCGVIVEFYDNDGFRVTFNIMNYVSRNMFDNAISKEDLTTWLNSMCEAVNNAYNSEEEED